jgi:cell division protein FtsQ
MNITATVLFAACGLLLAAALGWWALRHPVFAIGGITVLGDTTHNNVATLRANVAPRLAGNFFTVDLQQARAAFESVPWVRQAVVRRQFPNKLRVDAAGTRAEAFWGADSESHLVNTYGEVFEANSRATWNRTTCRAWRGPRARRPGAGDVPRR